MRDHAAIRLLDLGRLPLVLGAQASPRHEHGIPGRLPFSLEWRPDPGVVAQVFDPRVDTILERAYASGSLLGTAMDDSEAGRAYAEDFISFITASGSLEGQRTLEIGCGRGFLLARMNQAGAEGIGLEPGGAHAAWWARYGVSVIRGTFPSPKLSGRFDRVIAYGVLEHIAEPRPFLEAITARLSPGGRVQIAVPDCAPYLASGDPSILVHEHWLYYTASSLERVLRQAGLAPSRISRAGHGGVLYAEATAGSSGAGGDSAADLERARAFADGALTTRALFDEAVSEHRRRGHTLGIFAPARALSALPDDAAGAVRFFDDDPQLHGRYYPPFDIPVEDRAALLARPPDTLWILTRSFGARLAGELRPRLPRLDLLTCADLDARLCARAAGG